MVDITYTISNGYPPFGVELRENDQNGAIIKEASHLTAGTYKFVDVTGLTATTHVLVLYDYVGGVSVTQLEDRTPLLNQFTSEFENGLGFATVKLESGYTGACLRVMHPVTSGETDIGFAEYEGRLWIDNASATTFASGSTLLVTRCYLQGFNETGGTYLDVGGITNAGDITYAMDLVIGDTPPETHLLQDNKIARYETNSLAGGNLRNNGSVEGYYFATDRHRNAYFSVMQIFTPLPYRRNFTFTPYNVSGGMNFRYDNIATDFVLIAGTASGSGYSSQISFSSTGATTIEDEFDKFVFSGGYFDQFSATDSDEFIQILDYGKFNSGAVSYFNRLGATGTVEFPRGFGGSNRQEEQTGEGEQRAKFKCWIKILDAFNAGYNNLSINAYNNIKTVVNQIYSTEPIEVELFSNNT